MTKVEHAFATERVGVQGTPPLSRSLVSSLVGEGSETQGEWQLPTGWERRGVKRNERVGKRTSDGVDGRAQIRGIEGTGVRAFGWQTVLLRDAAPSRCDRYAIAQFFRVSSRPRRRKGASTRHRLGRARWLGRNGKSAKRTCVCNDQSTPPMQGGCPLKEGSPPSTCLLVGGLKSLARTVRRNETDFCPAAP